MLFVMFDCEERAGRQMMPIRRCFFFSFAKLMLFSACAKGFSLTWGGNSLNACFMLFSYSSKSKRSSSSSSNPNIGASLKSSSARRSFFVGRPVPRWRSMNPDMRVISRISYCLASVTFSYTSGNIFAPTRCSMQLRMRKEYVTGDFLTCTTSPHFTVREGFAADALMACEPSVPTGLMLTRFVLQALAAMVRVLNIRAAHSHLSRRAMS